MRNFVKVFSVLLCVYCCLGVSSAQAQSWITEIVPLPRSAYPSSSFTVPVPTSSNTVNGDNFYTVVVYGHDNSATQQTRVRLCRMSYWQSGAVCGAYASSGNTFTGSMTLLPVLPSGIGSAYDIFYLEFTSTPSSQELRAAIFYGY